MYYAVIGLQDDIKTSLWVMEAYSPLFFKGALKVYYGMGCNQRKQSRTNKPTKSIAFDRHVTPHKQTISDLARSKLATNIDLGL